MEQAKNNQEGDGICISKVTDLDWSDGRRALSQRGDKQEEDKAAELIHCCRHGDSVRILDI